MKLAIRNVLTVVVISGVMGCATIAPSQNNELEVPPQLAGKVTILGPSDPDYPRAGFYKAKNEMGKGGISNGLVIKTKEDVTVYRLWNGPLKVDDYGNTNRFGAWWSYEPPAGKADTYRKNYGVCTSWNDLSWVAKCTLKTGSVVAIGPGQSVSVKMCNNKERPESYSANPAVWQMYIDTPLYRRDELKCPKYKESDYEAYEDDISRRK